MSVKQTVFNHLKNIPGWRTKRKLVVISVDDYGNVRLDSKKARENMDKAGLKVHSRFDAYDTLETREDLEALYEVLTSVKDKNGRHAVFTPFALPCNINFEAMKEEGYEGYIYELLPDTYAKLCGLQPKAYTGTWDLWKEGIENGIMVPQFHGREHFNLKAFQTKLENRDRDLLISLDNRSNASIHCHEFETVDYTAAFHFWDLNWLDEQKGVIETGIKHFESVFGYAPRHFNPPGGIESKVLHPFLIKQGFSYLDSPWLRKDHKGKGIYANRLVKLGQEIATSEKTTGNFMVRNVVFEPQENQNALAIAKAQCKAAFFMNKPSIISTHRVNFCGHIDELNRKFSLSQLKELLEWLTATFPDVEFVSGTGAMDVMRKEN